MRRGRPPPCAPLPRSARASSTMPWRREGTTSTTSVERGDTHMIYLEWGMSTIRSVRGWFNMLSVDDSLPHENRTSLSKALSHPCSHTYTHTQHPRARKTDTLGTLTYWPQVVMHQSPLGSSGLVASPHASRFMKATMSWFCA